MDSPPLFMGVVSPKNMCDFSKKNSLFPPPTAQNFFQVPAGKKKIEKNQHTWTPRPQNWGGGVGHFGSGWSSTFTPVWGGEGLLKGYSPGWGNKIWCKPKVVPIKGYYLGDKDTTSALFNVLMITNNHWWWEKFSPIKLKKHCFKILENVMK